MNLEEMGKSLGLVTPWGKMWGEQTCPGLCPAWNLPPAGLMSRSPAVYFWSSLENSNVNTSASFPLAVENLLVCLNLENPKADVPFLVKNPFLKSEAWGFVFSYNWLLSTTQIVDGEKITCNLWRAIMFFLAMFDAVRISEALSNESPLNAEEMREIWVFFWCTWCWE